MDSSEKVQVTVVPPEQAPARIRISVNGKLDTETALRVRGLLGTWGRRAPVEIALDGMQASDDAGLTILFQGLLGPRYPALTVGGVCASRPKLLISTSRLDFGPGAGLARA